MRDTAKLSVSEPLFVRGLLVTVALGFLLTFLVLPIIVVFGEAFKAGFRTYLNAVTEPDAVSAMKLTLIAAAIAVPINSIFGLAAAWAIAKFRFRGRSLLLTIVDLPFAISPAICGLMFVLLYGLNGWLGPFLDARNLQVIFAVPGIILVTAFVTVPFVARELIPLMSSQGTEEEEASLVMGASGTQTFWHVTLPNVKWGLLYGVIVLNARAMGEFGAVSVVSGHIRGSTNTVPLHVEILYNEYHASAAFAVASLLTLLALVTLVAKTAVDRKRREKAPVLPPDPAVLFAGDQEKTVIFSR